MSESAINWLSTGFLFAFVLASPFVIYVLHHGGPKPAILVASVLLLLGNWIRYGATRSGSHGNFGGVMFGQILTGIAQPFVLAAPTRYSDLWFTNQGRVAATAVMSLANPFGGALAQLIDPFWAGSKEDIPNMVLHIAIIVSRAHFKRLFSMQPLHTNNTIVLNRHDPLLLHPRSTPNTQLRIFFGTETCTPPFPSLPPPLPRILHDHVSLLVLRRSLQ